MESLLVLIVVALSIMLLVLAVKYNKKQAELHNLEVNIPAILQPSLSIHFLV